MKAKEFKKLLKKHKDNPQEIIRMYCDNKIYITSAQFDKVLEARDGKRKKYESSVKSPYNVCYYTWLHGLWAHISKYVGIEALQERIRIYLARWR